MQTAILCAPKSTLNNFEEFFIELCSKPLKNNGFSNEISKKIEKKYLIPNDKIKSAFENLKDTKIKFVHLCGSEPMLHPEFNTILRFCLEYASCVVHTSGFSINDKKARFFAKVEKENDKSNEIFVNMKIWHYDEKTNDKYSYRGAGRKIIHAVNSLIKNNFTPILTYINVEEEDYSDIMRNLRAVFEQNGINPNEIPVRILPAISENTNTQPETAADTEYFNCDCAISRTLTRNGIYNCPMTKYDYRGYSGMDFTDFSKKSVLESPACAQCIKTNMSFYTMKNLF